MKRRMLLVGWLALPAAVRVHAQSKTTGAAAGMKETAMPSEEEHALIGTWRVVEFGDLDKEGKWAYRFGEHPRGYFVYDRTGHVHIQIMKVPPLPPFPESYPRGNALIGKWRWWQSAKGELGRYRN